MQIRFTPLIAGLALVSCPGLAAPREAQAPTIRVRVVSSSPEVRIRGVDLGLFSTQGGKGFRVSTDRVSEWTVTCPGQNRVQAQLKKPERGLKPWGFAKALRLESPSGFLTLGNRSFRERVVIHPVARGKRWECEVVNHVDIEKYLDGLVNSEFSSKWQAEAVDAQVIAARTYALHQMKEARRRGAHYDVEATVKDQVYDGAHKEDFRSSQSAARTRGMILTTPGSKDPIKAYYHSTCGGLTELPENVWGAKDRAHRRRVQCDSCQPSPSFLWEARLTTKQIARIVKENAQNATPEERKWISRWPKQWRELLSQAELERVIVQEQTPGGRARTLVMRWKTPGAESRLSLVKSAEAGEVEDRLPSSMSGVQAPGTSDSAGSMDLPLSAALFRIWADPVTLKSTAFQIFPLGKGEFLVRGRGYGHGVGLCQWGAKGMGEKKKSARAILSHYYPDAVLRRAW